MQCEGNQCYVVVARSVMFDQVIFNQGDVFCSPSSARLPQLLRAGVVRRLPVDCGPDVPQPIDMSEFDPS